MPNRFAVIGGIVLLEVSAMLAKETYDFRGHLDTKGAL